MAEDYRYHLSRDWPSGQGRLLWVMLNPSTADANTDDPTIRRCINFSKQWGYGGLDVVNLFAFRTPYPGRLLNVDCPVGIDNDQHLEDAVRRADTIIAAWGWRGLYRNRSSDVCHLLKRDAAGRVFCLGRVQNGSPRHPLYVSANTKLQAYL